MVGPRSSGCRTCVQRRIRCDGSRPRCTRCQKAGFQCAGYTPPLVFMPPVTASVGIKATSGALQRRRAEHVRSDNPSSRLDREVAISRDGELSFKMPGLVSVPTLNLTPSSYTDDAYFVFFLDRYFCFDNWHDDLQSNKAWFWKALQAPSQYPITNLASRALTTVFFARAHRTESLHQQAYHLHGLALKAMATQMQKGDLCFDILSANALLGLYEACSYTSQSGWQKHSRAMRTLYQSMGPDFFRQRPARSLLALCRYSIISESIISREGCFLAEEQWRNILASDDREASLTVKLGDIVIHVPGIFQGIKDLGYSHDHEGAAAKAQELFVKLVDHLCDLKQWWHQWSSDSTRLPKKVATTDKSQDSMPTPPSSPGFRYQFCNLEAAAGWCRYHAHVALALRWIRRLFNLQISETVPPDLCREYQDLGLTEDGAKFRVSEIEIQNHARAVCDGLHFYSLPRYRYVGAVYMGLPARVAWQCLPIDSPDSLWIEELMEFMATHSGWVIPRHTLRDIEVNESPSSS